MTPPCALPSTTLLTSLLTLKSDEILLRLNLFANNKFTYVMPNGGRPSTKDPTLTVRCDHYGSPSLKSYWKSHCEHDITFKPKSRFTEVGDGPWMYVGEMKGHNHGPRGKRSDYPSTKECNAASGTIKDRDSNKKKEEAHYIGKMKNYRGEALWNNMKYWDRTAKERSSKVNTTITSKKTMSSNSSYGPNEPLNSLPSSGGSSPSVTPISPPSTSKSAAQSSSASSSPILANDPSDSGSTTTTSSEISRLLTYGKDTSSDQDLQVKYDTLYTDHENAKQHVRKLKKDNQLLIDENQTNKKRIKELEDRLKEIKALSKSSTGQTTSTVLNHKKCKEVENKLQTLLDKANDKIEDLRKALKARDELDKLKEEEETIKCNREKEEREREMEEDRRKQEDVKRKEDDRKRKLKIDNEEKKLRKKRRKLLDDIRKGREQC
ncbi:hypothetical protein V865_000564 [Kwoniella europaea PYCC6329]|uniref:FAR1 domain-containing protein n=1 Tax=Kwoniella europaea PYCC6329 TaxID=1423913 RepID=A0AAX4K9E0_9TREE